jgi:hypothetical protein
MTTHQIADMLNTAFAADPDALMSLLKHRVPCNAALRDHPSVVCEGPDDAPTVGVGGLLQAIAALDGVYLCSVWDDDSGRLTGFSAKESWPGLPERT